MRIISFFLLLVGINSSAQLKGKYLGQKPPRDTAEIFAPGVVSTNLYEHSAPAFSPDGKTVLWTIIPGNRPSYLLEMRMENSVWTKPVPASFTDSTADDVYASFSVDGKKLYFASRRKLPKGYPEEAGTRIWEVEKKGNVWGKPMPFDTSVSVGKCFAHSVSSDGTIYFSVSGHGGTNWNIYSAEKLGEQYKKPEVLPYNINSFGYEDGPFIAADRSYLIFESDRPDGIEGSIDLYISFRDKEGRWSIPVNMGEKVNSQYMERFARVSPDGKYLFFGSNRRQTPGNVGADIYWIDAGVIGELREKQNKLGRIDSRKGVELLEELENSNYDKAVIKMKQWVIDHPEDNSALIDYSAVLRKNNQYAEAEKIVKDKLNGRTGDSNLQTELLLSLLAQNKKEEAENFIGSFIPGNAKKRIVYIKLASEYQVNGMNNESAAYFEKALSIQPSGYEFCRLAYAYIRENKYNEAINALENSVKYGYPKDYLAGDPTFQSLRSDSRFMKLVEHSK